MIALRDSSSPMTVKNLTRNAIEKLKSAGIESAGIDARLLIAHALHCTRSDLVSRAEDRLTRDQLSAIEHLISERVTHRSVARILGFRQFWGLEFGLNHATLEPRPDSETIVETVLKLLEAANKIKPFKARWTVVGHPLRILDLGTGTGCLLLALLHEILDADGVGIDVSSDAVTQATCNAQALGLHGRATFMESDWFQSVEGTFDIIISNPPYINAPDMASLMPEVREFDPHLALDGGPDGYAAYRHLIPQLRSFLNNEGIVAFEVGSTQAHSVCDLFVNQRFSDVQTHHDLAHIQRCVSAVFRP